MDSQTESALSPSVRAAFEKLCEDYPPAALPFIREHLENAFARISRFSDHILGPHLGTAQRLFDMSKGLLERYESYPAAERALIIGAIRYFIIEQDNMPDSTPLVGFDDDIAVLNHVLETLGLSERVRS